MWNTSELTKDELKERLPVINTDDILAAYFMPNDAVVNPVDTAMSMAIGARKKRRPDI